MERRICCSDIDLPKSTDVTERCALSFEFIASVATSTEILVSAFVIVSTVPNVQAKLYITLSKCWNVFPNVVKLSKIFLLNGT